MPCRREQSEVGVINVASSPPRFDPTDTPKKAPTATKALNGPKGPVRLARALNGAHRLDADEEDDEEDEALEPRPPRERVPDAQRERVPGPAPVHAPPRVARLLRPRVFRHLLEAAALWTALDSPLLLQLFTHGRRFLSSFW